MNVRFFDPGKSYQKIKNEILPEIDRVLTAGKLILQDDVERFEENFAKYVGTRYAVGVASGTDALILALKGCGLKEGQIVHVPSYTFRATVEAVKHAGGVPVLYDLDGDNSGLPEADFVIPAHIAGELRYPQVRKAVMIEDAAQAVGAGAVEGVAACYSFYPAKILGCYGDGGAVATNSESLYEHLKIMRNHYKGDWKKYGYNSRLDNVQAAVLNVKLNHLPNYIARRKEIARAYDERLKGVGLPAEREVYQDYIITHDDISGLQAHLTTQGVETMRNGYPFPEDLKKGPLTQKYEAKSLRIPCNPDLTADEVEHVIASINSYGH